MRVIKKLFKIAQRPICVGVFMGAVFIFAYMFVALPAFYIPNNNIKFQISTYSTEDYVLLFVLTLLSALSVTVQIYKWKNPSKTCKPVLPIYGASSTALSAAFAAIVGTATCAACVAPIVSLLGLGLGGTIFLLKYKLVFSAIAIFIIMMSIYLALKND